MPFLVRYPKFGQNLSSNFGPIGYFFLGIEIFTKKIIFLSNIEIKKKDDIVGQKSKLFSQIDFFVERRNFGQKYNVDLNSKFAKIYFDLSW